MSSESTLFVIINEIAYIIIKIRKRIKRVYTLIVKYELINQLISIKITVENNIGFNTFLLIEVMEDIRYNLTERIKFIEIRAITEAKPAPIIPYGGIRK